MGDQGPTPPIWLLPEPPERGWGLGRVDIVNAAVRLADQGGADALTMRAVAKELGASTPMSLYRYVHSKDGLVDLMLDLANGEVPTPAAPGGDWRGELTTVAVDTWAMTKRHPWYARLVHQRPPSGPNASRRTEFVLSTFDRLGQDLASALGYTRLLDGYVIGQALQRAEEQAMWQRNSFVDVVDVRQHVRSWFGGVGAEDTPYPLLVRVLESFLEDPHESDSGHESDSDQGDSARVADASGSAVGRGEAADPSPAGLGGTKADEGGRTAGDAGRAATGKPPVDRTGGAAALEDVQFELGLECLLDGIAARLR